MFIPYVIEKTYNSERSYDIYSRLLKDRIIFLGSEIDDNVANSVIAQLLFLDHEDSTRDVTMYINSPGGSVSAGFGIFDTMNYIKPDVCTCCIGEAASMGAFLLAAGAKGKRYSLPNSTIMIHQVLGGAKGQASDIQIHAEEIIKTKNRLNSLLSGFTGKPLKTIEKDTDRDHFLNAEEALEYGLIDKILEKEKTSD